MITVDPGASAGVAVWSAGKLAAVRSSLPDVDAVELIVIERPVSRWKGSVEAMARWSKHARRVVEGGRLVPWVG